MINLDRDHKIEVLLLTGLDEQWDDMHHDRSGAGSPLELCGPGPNRRVHNSLEIATRERISEDNLGQSRTMAASAGVPGSTTSRASTSASMTIAPRAASSAATTLFPDAMPPVRPTRTMASSLFWTQTWDQLPPVSFCRSACRASSEASEPSGPAGTGAGSASEE
jgi:hypothetical protein